MSHINLLVPSQTPAAALINANVEQPQPTHNTRDNLYIQQSISDYQQSHNYQLMMTPAIDIQVQPTCDDIINTVCNRNVVNINEHNSYCQPVMIASPEPVNNAQNRIKEVKEQIKEIKEFVLNSKNNDDEKQRMDVISQNKQICYWYNNQSGCREGKKCKFIHENYTNALREYATKCYVNKDINIKNIGIYLKNSLDGYDKINDTQNPGYIKFGTYSRTFCEVLCNYILKEKSFSVQTLYSKMKLLKYHKNFPTKSVNVIRLNTNKIIHGVQYNESARKRFIAQAIQQNILVSLYNITWWLFQNYAQFII